MSSATTRSTLLPLVALIFLAAVSRLLPHWPNFGPIGAMALFGAAAFTKKWMAWVVPFLALYLSDLVLNNLFYSDYYDGFYLGFNSWVYLGFALTLLLGFGLLRGKAFSWLRVGGTTVAGTLVFFLITNFGVWLGSAMYPKGITGLVAAYTAGLPFLLNSLAGNLVFAGLLFGAARYFSALPRPTAATERV